MIPFHKMHGLGNDFVIIDERRMPMQIIEPEQRARMVRQLAERRVGIGCDQLIVMRPTKRADVYMQIYNADGSEVEACGNATRCVAWRMMREKHKDATLIETEAGILECYLVGKGQVRVNMGIPRLNWLQMPLSREADTLHLPLVAEGLSDGVAVNMGNPHAVFFVRDVGSIPLKRIGPELEHHGLFPERANINIAQIDSSHHITLRTWERGAGETLACGTGACATVVAARRRELSAPNVTVQLPGGELQIEWQGSEADASHPVWMTGPVAESFQGQLNDEQWV
ncbi:MAG: diaminopimelate epimerase [Rickettsiales bacterium]|nr:diaminopimelate epimerase [Rickettsiales bacterium]